MNEFGLGLGLERTSPNRCPFARSPDAGKPARKRASEKRLPQFLLQHLPVNRHHLSMSFLVRRRQRESMRVHGSVSRQAIALVLETIETRSERPAPIVVEPRVLDHAAQLSEYEAQLGEPPPRLGETMTSTDSEPPPRASESWRVRAASKAYGAIAPDRATELNPRCSRRC